MTKGLIGFDETPEDAGRCPYRTLYRIAEGGDGGPVIQAVDVEDWYISREAAKRAVKRGERG